jgi:rhamnosyltransferase
MGTSRTGVLAVLVTYHPDPATLREVVSRAAGQVDRLVIVDNGSTEASRLAIGQAMEGAPSPQSSGRSIELVPNAGNLGIGVGFNQGIGRAREGGFEFVLLLDQDSVLREGAVARLVEEYRSLAARFPVGALQAHNHEASGRVNFDSRRRAFYERRGYFSGPTSYRGFYLLNSGAFFPLESFRTVGLLDERYFIVFVDNEISLRLAGAGLQIFHVPAAGIDHNVGPKPRPDPKRMYHATRELILMLATYWYRFPGALTPIVLKTGSRVTSMTLRSGRARAVLGMSLAGLHDGMHELGGRFHGVARVEGA